MAIAYMVERRSADPVFYWNKEDAVKAFLGDCRVKSWEEFWADEYFAANTEGSLEEDYISVDDAGRLTLIEIQDNFNPRRY